MKRDEALDRVIVSIPTRTIYRMLPVKQKSDAAK